MPRKTTKKRPIDQVASKSMNWWGKSFVFIKEKEVRSWQAIFAIAFFSGILATLIWSIPSGFSNLASAQDVGIISAPDNGCAAFPMGGQFSTSTAVNMKCGKLVKIANYKWSNANSVNIVNKAWNTPDAPIYASTAYSANSDLTLTISGKYHVWFFMINMPTKIYTFKKLSAICNDSDGGNNIGVKGVCTSSIGSFSDTCATSTVGESLVREYYCTQQKECAAIEYNCSSYGFNACTNGACSATSTSGNLLVTISSSTPPARNVIMGTNEEVLARFLFTADAVEDINLKGLTISDVMNVPAGWSVKNLKLYANGIQISEVSQATSSASTTDNIIFDDISLIIPKLTAKIVSLVGDASEYSEGAVSGSTHTFSILPSLNALPVKAVGSITGENILGNKLDIGGENDINVMANPITIYRSNITASWSSDTPQGNSTGAEGQTVGKINVTNLANVGNYNSVIKNLNFKIISNIGNASSTRYLKIYKDSPISANLVGTYTYAPGTMFGNTNLTQITPVYITSGQTKKFIVTLDTQGARANNYLSIGMERDDLAWSDGIVSIESADGLPLNQKSLSY